MKKIGLISTHDYLSTMAFVRTVIDDLSHDYEVLICEKKDAQLSFENDRTKKEIFDTPKGSYVVKYLGFYLKNIFKLRSDLSFTVGQWGIILGYLNKRLFGTEFINLNDELEFKPPFEPNLKYLLRLVLYKVSAFCGRSASFHITQDIYRARFLKLVFGKKTEILTLPNSTSGKAEYRKDYFLHERFEFTKEKKIIYWSASSTKIYNSGIVDLIELFKNEEMQGVCLFIHLRDDKAPDAIGDLEQMILDSKTDIIISKIPFNNEDYDRVIQSIDIGLVMYYLNTDMGPNVDYICKSSGQLNGYLKYGKPCLIQDLPGFRLLELGECCKIIEKNEMMKSYIEELLLDYNIFSESAVEYYDENLNFDSSYKLIKRMITTTINHA